MSSVWKNFPRSRPRLPRDKLFDVFYRGISRVFEENRGIFEVFEVEIPLNYLLETNVEIEIDIRASSRSPRSKKFLPRPRNRGRGSKKTSSIRCWLPTQHQHISNSQSIDPVSRKVALIATNINLAPSTLLSHHQGHHGVQKSQTLLKLISSSNSHSNQNLTFKILNSSRTK